MSDLWRRCVGVEEMLPATKVAATLACGLLMAAPNAAVADVVDVTSPTAAPIPVTPTVVEQDDIGANAALDSQV